MAAARPAVKDCFFVMVGTLRRDSGFPFRRRFRVARGNKSMSLKTTLLAAGSALILSAGAAAAAPAVAESPVHLRAGPGTQHPVITTIPGGATVDVAGCTGSWCRVNFNGEVGYASRNYLQLAGGPAPRAGVVAVAPGYYDEPIYDYYDYGYAVGPSIGFYASPGFRHRHRWHGRHGWHGRPG